MLNSPFEFFVLDIPPSHPLLFNAVEKGEILGFLAIFQGFVDIASCSRTSEIFFDLPKAFRQKLNQFALCLRFFPSTMFFLQLHQATSSSSEEIVFAPFLTF